MQQPALIPAVPFWLLPQQKPYLVSPFDSHRTAQPVITLPSTECRRCERNAADGGAEGAATDRAVTSEVRLSFRAATVL